MTKSEFEHWLVTQQSILEQIILEAGEMFHDEYKLQPNFGYDLQSSQEEAYNLSKGKDLCYDRYTTPLAYSLWYQARRINVFVSHFLDKLLEACNAGTPIEVFDLGAGTGCVQFCFGLAYLASRKLRGVIPKIRVINVDSSPFMLNYLQRYLWPSAVRHYPELRNLQVEYHIYSWNNHAGLDVINPWLCASYLFDSSDNEEYLESNFNELIEVFQPSNILLLSSAQQKKKDLISAVSSRLKQKSYEEIKIPSHHTVFQGNLFSVTSFRESLVSKYALKASTYPVTWNDISFTAIGLEQKQSGFTISMRPNPESLSIFNPPLKIRREVQLNDDQKKAARFETRPSIITGPAGCGKSIVVTEKIVNILEFNRWLKPTRILVTTFNISLLKQLRAWISDMVRGKNKIPRQIYYREVNNENDGTGKVIVGQDPAIEIEFIHFEMLGKYVGSIKYRPFDNDVHISKLERLISEVRQESNIPQTIMKNILSPGFILEEYHRIVYGLQCKVSLGESAYLSIDRKGRGKGLDTKIQRPAVYAVLRKYAVWMNTDTSAGQSYIARRQLLFNKLKSSNDIPLYDYVFVDEFQDCTKADFEIMNMLLVNTNNLVLAGDLAQAVHIGKSGYIPKDADSQRRQYHRLKGSYRLPIRVCEAIHPLSLAINKASIEKEATAELTPYKGAPPGARPIVVYAGNSSSLAKKILAIKKCYEAFDLNLITILEKDEILCREIRLLGAPCETSTILRLKGLEKSFIIWSLQANIEYEDETLEFAYTIMTRTNCLLVIAITNEIKSLYQPALNLLNNERLIYWDFESSKKFFSLSLS